MKSVVSRLMAQPYSARSRAIEPFHVMALLARANELQAAGHDVIHLEIGEPDFTPAPPIIAAGQAALASGQTRYTAARGLPALRQAISGYYPQRSRVDVDPERILITPGGSGALLLASSLVVDPGKHWLRADPGYPCNRHFLRLVEGATQLVPVGPEVRYQLTEDLVQRYWDHDTVGALVASPANPTGTLLSRDELAGLSKATRAHNGHLVVDFQHTGRILPVGQAVGRSIYTPISAHSVAMPSRSAVTSSKPSTLPLPRAWISAGIRPGTMCVLPIPKACRAWRKRWGGLPEVCGAGKADAISLTGRRALAAPLQAIFGRY